MADAIAVGIKLTNDTRDFEANTASAERAWGKLSGALGSLSSSTANITSQFQRLGLAAPESLGALGLAADGAVQGFAQAQQALTGLATAVPRLAALAFGPVGIAIAAAAAIGVGAWTYFKDKTFEIFGEVGGEAVTLSEAAAAAFDVTKGLIGEFAQAAFESVREWFGAMPDTVEGALGYVWETAKTIFTRVSEFVRATFEVITEVAGAAVQGMIATLPALWEAYKNVFTQIGKLGTAAWESLKSGSFEPLIAQARESGRSMIGALGDAARAGSTAFNAGLDASPAFQKFKTTAGEAADYVKKKFRDAVVGNRDAKSAEDTAAFDGMKAAGKKLADELVGQEQALQDALTSLTRAGIAARQALATDDLDRELRAVQSSFQLRRLSEVEYVNQSAELQRQKLGQTLNALSEERDAVVASVDRLIAQWVKLDQAGNTKEAIKTQTAIANTLKTQVDLTTKIEIAQRALSDVETERGNKLDAVAQKQLALQRQLDDQVGAYRRGIDLGNASRQFEISLIGKTREQQDILTARHAAELEVERVMIQLRQAELEAIRATQDGNVQAVEDANAKILALTQQAADARNNIDQVEADVRAKINATAAADMQKGLADALYNGLTSGKGVAASLRDYLKQMFNSLILRPAIQFGVQSLAGLLGGGGGAGGDILSSLLGGGGGGGGLGGLFSGLFSGLESTFISGFGSLFGSAGSIFAANLTAPVAAWGSAIAGFAEAGLGGAISALGGFAGALGAAIPVIGAIVGILAALGVFDNKTGIKIDNSVRDGRGRKDIINSGLGAFDVSGDIGNEAFAPLIAKVQDFDQRFIDAFLPSAEAVAQVQDRIQRISSDATDWFGFDDKESAQVAVGKASKLFLQQRYGTALEDVDATVAAMVKGFAGSADELLQFIDTIFVAQDALTALNEAVPGLTVSLGAMLGATNDQRNTLSLLAQTFQLTTSDYIQATKDAMAASNQTLSQALAAQNIKVADFAASLDGSLASAQALAQAEQQRLQMVVALIQQIGQISAEVSGMFKQSAEQFRLAAMTPDQQYGYFDQKAAETFALLKEATDPTRIRELAAQYNAYLNSGFGLLDADQRLAKGNDYAALAEQAAAIAQKQLDDAQAKAELEARALSTNIEGAIKTAMQVVADAMQKAADTMQRAAETPTTVVVGGRVTVEIESDAQVETTAEVGIYGVTGSR